MPLSINDLTEVLDESLFIHEELGYMLYYTPLTQMFEIVSPEGESLHHVKVPSEMIVKVFNTYIEDHNKPKTPW